MKNISWIIYAAQTVTIQESNRIIGFDKRLLLDLALQLANTLLLILGIAAIIIIPILSIRALRTYIKRNRK